MTRPHLVHRQGRGVPHAAHARARLPHDLDRVGPLGAHLHPAAPRLEGGAGQFNGHQNHKLKFETFWCIFGEIFISLNCHPEPGLCNGSFLGVILCSGGYLENLNDITFHNTFLYYTIFSNKMYPNKMSEFPLLHEITPKKLPRRGLPRASRRFSGKLYDLIYGAISPALHPHRVQFLVVVRIATI